MLVRRVSCRASFPPPSEARQGKARQSPADRKDRKREEGGDVCAEVGTPVFLLLCLLPSALIFVVVTLLLYSHAPRVFYLDLFVNQQTISQRNQTGPESTFMRGLEHVNTEKNNQPNSHAS